MVEKQKVCYKHAINEALSHTDPFPPLYGSIVDNNEVGQPQKIDETCNETLIDIYNYSAKNESDFKKIIDEEHGLDPNKNSL